MKLTTDPSGNGEWLTKLRNAAMRAVTEDDMRDIFKALVEKAKRGDRQATELLMKFVLPAAAPAPKTPELRPPAQQVRANVVNIYAGKKPRKAAGVDPRKVIEHRNGN